MKEKLQTVFRSKYFYLVVSIGVAVALWILALNTLNPVVENTIDVAITYVNENAPAEKNLSRTSELGVVMSTIRVSGRRDTVNNLLTSEISVEVDFSDVEKPGMARLKVKAPTCKRVGVKIEDYYPKEIEVSYDTKSEMYLDVVTEYTNDLLADGYEFISVVAEPDSIPISGFASEIEDLDHISARLAEKFGQGTINESQTISLLGKYITKGGKDITANFSAEKVAVKIEVAKRVPLIYSIVGEVGDDFYIANHIISKDSVLLQGSAEALKDIESISVGSIDVNGVTSTVSKIVDINDYVAEGVTVYGDASRTIKVEIEKYATKTMTFDLDAVSQPGLNDKLYNYDIEFAESTYPEKNMIDVIVKGRSDDLEKITVIALSPKINLNDINDVGQYHLPILFSEVKGIEIIGEYSVNVKVTPASPEISDAPVASATPSDSVIETPTGSPVDAPVELSE